MRDLISIGIPPLCLLHLDTEPRILGGNLCFTPVDPVLSQIFLLSPSHVVRQ